MKQLKIIGVLAVLSLALTGCGIDSMPELTDDESAIITEYAAGLLLKYSPNYDYKLVDSAQDTEDGFDTDESALDTETPSETQPLSEAEESTFASEEESTLDAATNESEEETAIDTAGGTTVSPDSDLAQALGISGAKITYSSYEVCDSYPKTSTGFSVSASQGGQLLVVHFDLENESEEGTVNLMDYNLSSVVTVNGQGSSSALDTLLANDMISYYDNMKSGEVSDVVMLFQIKEDLAENIENISLKVASGAGSVQLALE